MENNNITYTHLFTDQLKEEFNKKEGPTKKVYAVMQFNTEFELGISNKPYEWVNSSTFITTNGAEALLAFHKSENPMTKIIDAPSFDELNKKMIKTTKDFKNPMYVNKVIEPFYY